ncbi:LytR C-terminal domain-containing protein [Candidatus Curtissbacteria bacterium]|nr:LytR C-terminal domain-containing protein [Candidatus Curtissbacteria bacterium]
MDNEQQPTQPSYTTQSPIYQEAQESKNAKWLWILIALIIVGALAFAFFKGIGPFGRFKQAAAESPTPTAFAEASASPEASAGANIDKTKAKLRVLNGSGKAGVASSAKDYIESKGYKVTAVGNAKNFDFTDTVVKLKTAFANFKDALVADLSGKYSVTVSSEPLEATDSADIEVTVGSK